MIGQYLFAVGMMGMIIISILVMTRILSLAEAAQAAGRIILAVILGFIAFCILRQAVLSVLPALLLLLKTLWYWLVVTVFATLLVMLACGTCLYIRRKSWKQN
jgi:hypothetical protein